MESISSTSSLQTYTQQDNQELTNTKLLYVNSAIKNIAMAIIPNNRLHGYSIVNGSILSNFDIIKNYPSSIVGLNQIKFDLSSLVENAGDQIIDRDTITAKTLELFNASPATKQALVNLGELTHQENTLKIKQFQTVNPITNRAIFIPALIGSKALSNGLDPETGETVSKTELARRQKVVDPATGEAVSKNALAMRQKVVDPATGETVSKNALTKRQKVVDPATGETVSKTALAKRQKVVDPATGETVSKNALAKRQKVVDPATGETVSKNALAKRQKVVDPATGETVSKTALAMRQKKRAAEPA
jgi:hypothetical protein